MKMKKLLTLLLVCGLAGFGLRAQQAIAIQKTGSGNPLVFLPHIGCSSEMWAPIVAHYSKYYTCYQVDFAGFYKIPAIDSAYTPKYVEALVAFIEKEKLKQVVVIGQNYGAYVGVKLAARLPGNIKCVVASDFYPKLSMVLDTAMSAGKWKAIKKSIIATTLDSDRETFRKSQKYLAQSMNFMDTSNVSTFVNWQCHSDRKTLAGTLCEQMEDDLIPALKSANIPILSVSTWYFAKTYKKMPVSESEPVIRKMFGNAGSVTYAVTEEAKDFIASDQPLWFIKTVNAFLEK